VNGVTQYYVAGHALIKRENKYLVMRRSKKSGYMPLKWDIPGGLVHHGETEEETVYREVSEKTGLTIQIKRVIYMHGIDQLPTRFILQLVYLCEYRSGEIRLNSPEHDTYKWVDYNDLADADMIDFVREVVKLYHP